MKPVKQPNQMKTVEEAEYEIINVNEEEGFGKRMPVVLALDTSGSMDGRPIKELNEALKVLPEELGKDEVALRVVEVSLVTFGGSIETSGFCHISEFVPPVLSAGGLTPMGPGAESSLDLAQKRVQSLKEQAIDIYTPLIIILSDGMPTGSNEPEQTDIVIQKIRDLTERGKILFAAVGSSGADFERLKRMTPDETVYKMDDFNYRSLFRFISHTVSSSIRGTKLPYEGEYDLKKA